MKQLVKFIQTHLASLGYDIGRIDGIVGPRTLTAISQERLAVSHWKKKRQSVAAAQKVLSSKGYVVGDIDGYYGPATDAGFQKYLIDAGISTGELRKGVGSSCKWPTTDEDELNKYYGVPGTNLTRAVSPYPLRIAWNKAKVVRSFVCHEEIKGYVEEALLEVQEAYSSSKMRSLGLDLFGGCYNQRTVRGGNRKSVHSWAIAIDWNPTENKLRMKSDRASFAQPEYSKWREIWSKHSFVNLGECKDYDWMHYRHNTP